MRPNKLRLDAGQVLVVSDGKTLTTAVAPFKKYTAAPAPKTITFETFREGPLGSVLFGGPTAPPMFILLNLLVGSDPAKTIGDLGGALALDADREVDGDPVQGPPDRPGAGARPPPARRSPDQAPRPSTWSSTPRTWPRRGSRTRSRSTASAGRRARSRPRTSRPPRSPSRPPGLHQGRVVRAGGGGRRRSIRSTSSSASPPPTSP